MERQKRFIEKAKNIHGDKYDYSKVSYVDFKTKVCIICPKHGEFWITPQNHLKGHGCPKCSYDSMRKGVNKFIEEARMLYGDIYDYSKVEYKNSNTKVCIICPKHGEFWQKPAGHLNGHKCPKCSHRSYAYTKEEIISEFIKIHGNKYDYSNVEYVNNSTKVRIICPIHGEFWQRPIDHLNGQGCPKCSHRSYAYKKEEWVDMATKLHNGKYDYSKVEYVNNRTKVCIICPIHGEFWQTPSNHLNSYGCRKCGKTSAKDKLSKNERTFIKNSKSIFGNQYDYSKVAYANNKTKVCLICKKHGEFWVRPDGHLAKHQGCPQCAAEKNVNETILFEHLKNRFSDIEFFHSKRGIEGLGNYEIDIYDAKNKIAIEYQGEQHFQAIPFFDGENGLAKTIQRDCDKKRLCEEIGIKLFHFTYDKNYCKDNIDYKVYTDENELFSVLDGLYKKIR